MKRDIKSIFVSFAVFVLSFSISFNSVFADSTMSIVSNIYNGLGDYVEISYLGAKAINVIKYYDLDSTESVINTVDLPLTNWTVSNINVTSTAKKGLIHIQTSPYDIASTSDFQTQLANSGIIIFKITFANSIDFFSQYLTKVCIWNSRQSGQARECFCIMKPLTSAEINDYYIMYVVEQGDISTTCQFNIDFYLDFPDNITEFKFGIGNNTINIGSTYYFNEMYNIQYMLARFMNTYNSGGDVSGLIDELKLIDDLMSEGVVNIKLIRAHVIEINNKLDSIQSSLDLINNNLVDSTDNKSWLSKIFDKLVNSDTSSTTSSDIDNTTSKLDELDNSVDLDLINNNINNNISNVTAPSTNNFKESLNSFVWLKEYSQNTFNSLSGSAVNLDRFKILYSVPIVILLLCLLI